ncbi:MAG: hypothetical protein PVI25_07425, partial [Gammaproteobacteria bacterium]
PRHTLWCISPRSSNSPLNDWGIPASTDHELSISSPKAAAQFLRSLLDPARHGLPSTGPEGAGIPAFVKRLTVV